MESSWTNKTLWETVRFPLMKQSFRETIKSPRIWFRDLRIGTRGLEMYHLNAHNFVVTRVFFLSLSPRNFDDQIELKKSPVCYFWMLRYPKWEDWSLTILVSSVFKLFATAVYRILQRKSRVRVDSVSGANCLWKVFNETKWRLL